MMKLGIRKKVRRLFDVNGVEVKSPVRDGECMWAPFSGHPAENSAQRAGGGEGLRYDVLSQRSDGL